MPVAVRIRGNKRGYLDLAHSSEHEGYVIRRGQTMRRNSDYFRYRSARGMMDPLSDALSLLRVRNAKSGGFDAGEHWSLAFDQHDGVKFYAVVSGECWIVVDGAPDPVRVAAGDCFLLPRGRAYRITSDLSLSTLDAGEFFSNAIGGRVNVYNGGGKFFSICG